MLLHESTVHFVGDKKPYKCEKCHSTFTSDPLFKRHLQVAHDPTRPYECSTCFQTFRSKEKLDHHFERRHNLRNCEDCPYCGKQVSRLKPHMEICNAKFKDGKRPMYECSNGCGATFINKEGLRGHIRKSCKKKKSENN